MKNDSCCRREEGGSMPERSSGGRRSRRKSRSDLMEPPLTFCSDFQDKEKRPPIGSLTVISKNYQIARVTLPERKQRVQA